MEPIRRFNVRTRVLCESLSTPPHLGCSEGPSGGEQQHLLIQCTVRHSGHKSRKLFTWVSRGEKWVFRDNIANMVAGKFWAPAIYDVCAGNPDRDWELWTRCWWEWEMWSVSPPPDIVSSCHYAIGNRTQCHTDSFRGRCYRYVFLCPVCSSTTLAILLRIIHQQLIARAVSEFRIEFARNDRRLWNV